MIDAVKPAFQKVQNRGKLVYRIAPEPTHVIVIATRFSVMVTAYLVSYSTPEPFDHLAALVAHVFAVLFIMAIFSHSEKAFARFVAERLGWVENKPKAVLRKARKPEPNNQTRKVVEAPKPSGPIPPCVLVNERPRDSWKGLNPEQRREWLKRRGIPYHGPYERLTEPASASGQQSGEAHTGHA